MDNQASYNKIARQWAAVRKTMPVSNLVIDFAQRVRPNGHILDIGCGSGLPLAKYLSDQGFHLTGIDISGEMIKIAKTNSLERAAFFVSDFLDFVSVEKFDGILAWDSLWHITKNLQKNIYHKISDLLLPGGLFLFTSGNIEDEHIDTMMGERFYYSALSEPDLVNCLHQNRLKIEYSLKNFIEQNSHRMYAALARKM